MIISSYPQTIPLRCQSLPILLDNHNINRLTITQEYCSKGLYQNLFKQYHSKLALYANFVIFSSERAAIISCGNCSPLAKSTILTSSSSNEYANNSISKSEDCTYLYKPAFPYIYGTISLNIYMHFSFLLSQPYRAPFFISYICFKEIL